MGFIKTTDPPTHRLPTNQPTDHLPLTHQPPTNYYQLMLK